jgi:hypothetical protein
MMSRLRSLPGGAAPPERAVFRVSEPAIIDIHLHTLCRARPPSVVVGCRRGSDE